MLGFGFWCYLYLFGGLFYNLWHYRLGIFVHFWHLETKIFRQPTLSQYLSSSNIISLIQKMLFHHIVCLGFLFHFNFMVNFCVLFY